MKDSDDEEEKISPNGSGQSKNSKHSVNTFLSSKNQYCISNTLDIEILETTLVNC